MIETTKKLAAIYCRVSSKKQLDNTSLDSQADECRKKASELDYHISKVVREQHSGAELQERSKLMALREIAQLPNISWRLRLFSGK